MWALCLDSDIATLRRISWPMEGLNTGLDLQWMLNTSGLDGYITCASTNPLAYGYSTSPVIP